MNRVGFLLKVKEDMLDEYKKHHETVWPEMLEALSRTGWHNYSLFMREDGLLFGYFETSDTFQTALDGMAKEEINRPFHAVIILVSRCGRTRPALNPKSLAWAAFSCASA